MKIPFLVGRLIFGGFFLYNGINHFKNHKMMAKYTAAKNVPVPDAAVLVTGTAFSLGGASILLGIKPKVGALALIGFLAGVSLIMHNFWKVQDPQQRATEMAHFAKNMALLGGALALSAVEEPWPISVPVDQPSGIQRVRQAFHRAVAA